MITLQIWLARSQCKILGSLEQANVQILHRCLVASRTCANHSATRVCKLGANQKINGCNIDFFMSAAVSRIVTIVQFKGACLEWGWGA